MRPNQCKHDGLSSPRPNLNRLLNSLQPGFDLKPHMSQDERPELFDVLPLELAVNRALAPGDIDFDFLRLGDFSEIVHCGLVDGMFDQSAARFFALVQAANT